MKLREIIEKLDRDPSNQYWIDNDSFIEELGLTGWYNEDLEDHGFSAYYLVNWICTDTHVGGAIIFYEGEPIATTWQSGRKNPTTYFWIGGHETRKRIAGVVRDLMSSEDLPCLIADLDTDYPDGIGLEFSEQITYNKQVIYKDELVDVIKKFSDMKMWKKVIIRDSKGVEQTVDMSEITIPFNLKKD